MKTQESPFMRTLNDTILKKHFHRALPRSRTVASLGAMDRLREAEARALTNGRHNVGYPKD